MRIFSEELNAWVRHKPLSSIVLFVLAMAAFGVIGEFSVGFLDGFMEEITDAD